MRRLLPLLALLCACSASEPAPETAPRAPSQRLAFEGFRVHYEDLGAGEPALVLVHGWASDVRAWTPQLETWSETWRLLVVDLPGHGESEAPTSPYSMELFADSLAAVLDHAGVERAVLVGHSNGGTVVTRFAQRHPDRTLGLVVVDGSMRLAMPREAGEQMFSRFTEETWREALRGMLTSMPNQDLSSAEVELIATMATEQTWGAVRGGFDAAFAEDAYADTTVEAPVLSILTPSPLWTDAYREEVAAVAPRVEFVELDTQHWVQFEQPEALRELVAGFVAELAPAR